MMTANLKFSTSYCTPDPRECLRARPRLVVVVVLMGELNGNKMAPPSSSYPRQLEAAI